MIKLRVILFFLYGILYKCEILDAACAKQEISKVCQTSECKNAASTILQSIDPKVAPCDDFYKFACGNFLKTRVMPKNDTSIDRYSSLDQKIREQLKSNLEEPTLPNEPRFITLSKNFYKACMNTTAIDKNGIQTVLGKLKKAGGWPVLEGDLWKEENFDWKQATYEMRNLGFNVIYFFYIDVFGIDTSKNAKDMLNIDEPFITLENDFFENGFNKTIIAAYYNYMVDTAVLFGANRARAEKELNETLQFEIQLAHISLSEEDRRKQDPQYNLMTVTELTKKCPSIPWKEYFNTLLNSTSVKIGDDEPIEVNEPTFFEKFEVLMKKTPKRVLANYIFWQAVQESSPYLTDKIIKRRAEFMNVRSPGSTERQTRWEKCLDMTSDLLGVSIGALYVRKNLNQESKKNVVELAADVKEQWKEILKKVEWMDEKTRASALTKLESTKIFIGSPDELLDDKTMNEYHKTVEITPDDLLQAYLNITFFNVVNVFRRLRKPVDKSDWLLVRHSETFDTNAANDDDYLNRIDIPAGILQDIFFNKDRPQYLNYAGIGSFVIGNVISRAFDNRGSKYDTNGKFEDWWTPETRTKFLQKAACINQQYGNYAAKGGGVKLNDTQTEDRNIADNGGVKISYLAYQDWVKSHGPEPTLPGLNYSQSQLFWIQTAITQCAQYTPEYAKKFQLKNEILNVVNFPSEFRVTGVFANRPEFARDFNCPVGSKMNPVEKCSVW